MCTQEVTTHVINSFHIRQRAHACGLTVHGSADSAISNSRRRFETAYNVSTRSAAQMPSIAYTHYASALRVTEFSNAIEIHCTLLHELACNNRDKHANECNKMFIIHYLNSVVVTTHTKNQVTRCSNAPVLIKAHHGC